MGPKAIARRAISGSWTCIVDIWCLFSKCFWVMRTVTYRHTTPRGGSRNCSTLWNDWQEEMPEPDVAACSGEECKRLIMLAATGGLESRTSAL
jgi:hypothetical protein